MGGSLLLALGWLRVLQLQEGDESHEELIETGSMHTSQVFAVFGFRFQLTGSKIGVKVG